jgi:lipopolysaccharide assembly protein B
MLLDFTGLLILLPVVFGLGWLASRFDLRQWRMENQLSPKPYFKGLNHLLNGQHDQAIDAFVQAVQSDPDTTELHFALGNLFRRRGDLDRAVRVHEHLLSRGDLSVGDRERAQMALADDFLGAGLLDRAEAALLTLQGSRLEKRAQLALLTVFERSRDWQQADRTAQWLETHAEGSFASRRAHYLSERAATALRENDTQQAHALLTEAIHIAPDSARARIDLAHWYVQARQPTEAWSSLMAVMQYAPAAAPLVAHPLAQLAAETHRLDETRHALEAAQDAHRSLDVLEALVELDSYPNEVTHENQHVLMEQRYRTYLNQESSIVAATRWLNRDAHLQASVPRAILQAIDHAARPAMRYRCAACSFEARQHFWQCPGCQAWDSYPARRVEEL